MVPVAKRHRKFKHNFAFSRLVTCGHCGCSLVGEIKKGRYIYYHCSGYRGKCLEPYTREEVLEERFADLLKGLVFDQEVITWVREALGESHADEQRLRDEAVTQLQAQHAILQRRLDTMYEDKLDGRVDETFFDRKAAEWRAEQARLLQAIEAHNSADQTYMDEGVRLLELAGRAHELFKKQEPSEKRRLLNFLLSNSTWRDGTLSATFRQPFDMLVVHTYPPMPPGFPRQPNPYVPRDHAPGSANSPVNSALLQYTAAERAGVSLPPGPNPMAWGFYYDDVPEEIVRRDLTDFPVRGGDVPVWGSATVPGLAAWVLTPGAITPEAAAIVVPVLLGFGERDVLDDPWMEPKAYPAAVDISLFVCPRMGHMHNFASSREVFWSRTAVWGQHVAELKQRLPTDWPSQLMS